MRHHRFFTDADISGKTVSLSKKDLVHQIVHVLRLAKGDEMILCKDGYDARIRIVAILKNGIEGEIISLEKNTAEPKKYVILHCSVLKKENFEMVIQKAIEAGTSEIVPLKTKRTVKTGISHDRLEKIAQEAAEQCGRARIPVIREPVEFSSIISIIKRVSPSMSSRAKQSEVEGSACIRMNILFDASGEDAGNFFQNQKKKENDRINIFIGPEGGWDTDEVAVARNAGFHILSLGPRTLRAETAAIIGTFITASL